MSTFHRLPSRAEDIAKIELWQQQYGHLVFKVSCFPEGGVLINRKTLYGNPFPLHDDTIENRIDCLLTYLNHVRDIFLGLPAKITLDDIIALRGKKLVCHCSDGSNVIDHSKWCHGIVLAAVAEILYIRRYGC